MISNGAIPEPLLKVEDIHTYYGKSHILHGVSLVVGHREVVGLLGRTRPMMLLSVVLLPTPLRPSSPTTSPRRTSRETPSRMWLLP